MSTVLIVLLEIGAALLIYAMFERAHDAKVNEYTAVLRFMHRLFGVNKTCLHYAGCPNPGMKNTSANFSASEEQAITRKAVEIEEKLTLDRATKTAAKRTRKNVRTIEKHEKTVQ